MCKCGGSKNKPRTNVAGLDDPRNRSIFDPPAGGVNDPRNNGNQEDPANDPRIRGALDPRNRGNADPRVAGRTNAIDPRTNGNSLVQQLLAQGQLSEQNLQSYLAGRGQADLASALRVHAT